MRLLGPVMAAERPAAIAPAGKLWLLTVTALVAYSLVLLYIEATTSQEYVRSYFTDIGRAAKKGFYAAPDGQIGYAINTACRPSTLVQPAC